MGYRAGRSRDPRRSLRSRAGSGSPAALPANGAPYPASNRSQARHHRSRPHEHDQGRGRYRNFLQGLGHELSRLVLGLQYGHLDQSTGARLPTERPCRFADADRGARNAGGEDIDSQRIRRTRHDRAAVIETPCCDGSRPLAPGRAYPVAHDDAVRRACAVTVSRASRSTSRRSGRFVPSSIPPASTPE